MEYAAPYLAVADAEEERDPMGFSPEFSRRARSLPVWAAIRSLGRRGVAEMIEGSCASARSIAAGLEVIPGCEILNDVVLNQVLVRFESDERTRGVLQAVQQEGEAYPSHGSWDGRAAIRISVSCWRTNEDDVRRTVDAFARAAATVT
jgi:glutamate/tyrosine decarboxylase-like PLP-dependent enzyme